MEPLIGGTKGKDSKAFGVVVLVTQCLITFGFYNSSLKDVKLEAEKQVDLYNFYIGVACMMFVGFGYLMTFLKAYGLGAVGFTMFITCIGVEWAVLVEGAMAAKGLSIELDFMSLLNGNFAVAAVLISFGGLIGKLGPLQLLVLTLVELTCYCANKVYVLGQYDDPIKFQDCGGTIIIHVFGAYFGLMACKVLGKPQDPKELNASSYTSDIFSLVGTVFLWLFWPSFVAGAVADPDQRFTALVNTVLALLSSTVVTFAVTPLLEDSGKLTTVPVQNATLAGGVSIGATANLVGPFGAVVVGALAGLLSTYGFVKSPFFSDCDTCGISNLHGMPGLLGGLVSVAVPTLYKLDDADSAMQTQAVGLAATLGVACVAGAITGACLKTMGHLEQAFDDKTFWECAE